MCVMNTRHFCTCSKNMFVKARERCDGGVPFWRFTVRHRVVCLASTVARIRGRTTKKVIFKRLVSRFDTAYTPPRRAAVRGSREKPHTASLWAHWGHMLLVWTEDGIQKRKKKKNNKSKKSEMNAHIRLEHFQQLRAMLAAIAAIVAVAVAGTWWCLMMCRAMPGLVIPCYSVLVVCLPACLPVCRPLYARYTKSKNENCWMRSVRPKLRPFIKFISLFERTI